MMIFKGYVIINILIVGDKYKVFWKRLYMSR